MITKAFEQGEGILRLAPTWVPRSFCIPGKRIKLHPATTTLSARIAAVSMSGGLPRPRKLITGLSPRQMKA